MGPLSRITALGYNSTRMDDEIKASQKTLHIGSYIAVRFQIGQSIPGRKSNLH